MQSVLHINSLSVNITFTLFQEKGFDSMTPQIAAFIVYFAAVLAIGLVFFFKSKGTGEKIISSADVQWVPG